MLRNGDRRTPSWFVPSLIGDGSSEGVKEENNTSKKNLVYFQIIHKHNLQYKNANTCQKYKKNISSGLCIFESVHNILHCLKTFLRCPYFCTNIYTRLLNIETEDTTLKLHTYNVLTNLQIKSHNTFKPDLIKNILLSGH